MNGDHGQINEMINIKTIIALEATRFVVSPLVS